MSETELKLVIVILVWTLWLLWTGRPNSPRNRERRARIEHLLREAARDHKSDDS